VHDAGEVLAVQESAMADEQLDSGFVRVKAGRAVRR
jgi:hypothetical protein